MLISKRCKFYRNSDGIGMGLGLGHCDLDAFQTICDGDIKFCEKPNALKDYCIQIIRIKPKTEEKPNQEFFKKQVHFPKEEFYDDRKGR